MIVGVPDRVIAGLTRTELIALVRKLEKELDTALSVELKLVGDLVAALDDCYKTLEPSRVSVLLPQTIETIRKTEK